MAVKLAKESGAHLHVAHLTTAKELELLQPEEHITGEACVAHLYFCDADYASKGTLIKCNPAIKTAQDRAALRQALNDGKIACFKCWSNETGKISASCVFIVYIMI